MRKRRLINASCCDESAGRADASFVERLLAQRRALAPGFKVMLFGFDWARDAAGAALPDRSTFHVPDNYGAGLAQKHSAQIEWVASVHPTTPRRWTGSTPQQRAAPEPSNGCPRPKT